MEYPNRKNVNNINFCNWEREKKRGKLSFTVADSLNKFWLINQIIFQLTLLEFPTTAIIVLAVSSHQRTTTTLILYKFSKWNKIMCQCSHRIKQIVLTNTNMCLYMHRIDNKLKFTLNTNFIWQMSILLTDFACINLIHRFLFTFIVLLPQIQWKL